MFGILGLLMLIAAGYIGASIAVRRLREGSGGDPQLRELRERLNRLEQTMESVTGELERVAESQQFLTALLEDRGRAKPALPEAEGERPR
jgi:hypothetical protein